MKAIVCDVNKTLIKDRKYPIQEVVDFINYAFDHGYKILLISGAAESERPEIYVSLIRAQVKFHSLHLTANGRYKTEFKTNFVGGVVKEHSCIYIDDNNTYIEDIRQHFNIDAYSVSDVKKHGTSLLHIDPL